MKSAYVLIAAGLVAATLAPAPLQAASLLGGLITTGQDSNNGSGLISTNNGSIGVGGSNGVSVNLGGVTGGLTGGLTGGGSGGGGTSGGSTTVGVPGVATASVGSNSSGGSGVSVNLGGGGGSSGGLPSIAGVSLGTNGSGGTGVGVSLLGGGSTNIGLNPGGLLGTGGGLNVSLPGLGGGNGTPGTPGAPGRPGTPGAPGTNGVAGLFGGNGGNGNNGFNGLNGLGGRNGTNGVVIPDNISSKLRTLLNILAAKQWIRLADGRAICLDKFGKAEISTWLPQKDWAFLNRALPKYANDIATLRELLANCTDSRQALNMRDVNRVVGIALNKNGMPILYML